MYLVYRIKINNVLFFKKSYLSIISMAIYKLKAIFFINND
jgi:hypothetical protein